MMYLASVDLLNYSERNARYPVAPAVANPASGFSSQARPGGPGGAAGRGPMVTGTGPGWRG